MLKLKIFIPLDEYTSYHFDHEDKLILNIKGVRESTNNNENILKYTKGDLEKYYTLDRNPNKLLNIKENKAVRHFIINEKLNMIFIPIVNKYKNIINYTCSELFYLEKLKLHTFYRNITNGKEYIRSGTTREYMHEIIFGRKAYKGCVIDHIYSNTMDNRMKFLREITKGENNANRKTEDGVFTGVSKNSKKWVSTIIFNKKKYHLGSFSDKLEAGRVRDMYSVYFYRGIQALNKINGKNLLTNEEIEDILQNGIPEKYKIVEKNKDILSNICQIKNKFSLNLSHSKYFKDNKDAERYLKSFKDCFDFSCLNKIKIIFKNEEFYFKCKFIKTYNILEEAVKNLNKLENHIKTYEILYKKKLEDSIDKNRNKEGVAIIKAFNGMIKTYENIEVDDEDWLKYIHYSWYISKSGYPINKKMGTLHLAIFKHNFSEIYKNKLDDETVDHKDQNKNNARKNNLRLASRSIQNQNKEYLKYVSFTNFQGIIVQNGNFYTEIKNNKNRQKYGPYLYLEEAALKYNEIVLSNDPDAKINIVSDSKTTVEILFHKDNITIKYVKNIKTLVELKEIFRNNLDWKNESEISLRDMRFKNLEEYKEIILDLIENY